MIYNQEFTNRVSTYVKELYKKYQTPDLVYHNLSHTQYVVDKTGEISLSYSLEENDLFILFSAAWFHDCGHLLGPAKDHEVKSVSIMQKHLKNIGVENAIINSVEQCILSTRLPANPRSLLAEILCDADLYHLGTNDFFIINERVKKEFELRNHFPHLSWDQSTLSLLENHIYFTNYCKDLLEKEKLKNIKLMRIMLKKEQ